jgi:predicted metal-dependent hydrolase
MSETLEISGLHFEIRRSAKRKTVGLTVDRASQLVVHAPADADRNELQSWAGTKLLWVHRKLAIKRELETKVRSPEYLTGESFNYLGRRYRLKIVARQDEPLHFGPDGFRLRANARAKALEHFHRWYAAVGTTWVQERVHTLTRKIGAEPLLVEIRELGFRWGSCTQAGKIFINWKLLQLPVRLADYVIMHELGHLVVHNHGPEFWALLDRSMPDWKKRQEELQKKATEIYWCHSEMTG